MPICKIDRGADALRHAHRVTVSLHDQSPSTTSRTITICHPVWRLASGGLERQLLTAVARLPRVRFRHILAICDPAADSHQINAEFPNHALVWRMPKSGFAPNLSEQLASLLASHDVDVLHVRGLSLLIDSIRAADLIGDLPVAMSFHGFEEHPPQFSRLRRDLYRAAIERCDHRWAVSREAARACCECFAIAPDRFDTVSNGVDTDYFKPSGNRSAAKADRGLAPDRPVVLCVGNIKPVKGQEVLVEAAQILSRKKHAFTLVLAGRDDSHGRLQQLAAGVQGSAEIIFTGHTDDVRPWLHAADVFVQPSRWEGLSNSLLEAMSCGLPVVATSVGGTMDVIEKEKSGLLVPPNDAKALAASLERTLTDASLCRELGHAARQRVCHEFKLTNTLAALAAQYEMLAKQKRKQAK